MKRFTALVIMMAMIIGALPAHAAGPSEQWEQAKKQCEEQGLQVTWYLYAEGLMRRYGTDRMLLVEGGQSCLCKLNDYTNLVGPFDAFGYFNADGLAPACQNGKWGVVDRKGETVVDFLYDTQAQAEAAGGLAPVIPESVDEDAFHEGLCRVQSGENGLWGFVNEAGEQVVPCLFDGVGYFDRGYASVLADGVFGLLRNPLLNVGGTALSDKDISFTDVPAGSWFEKGVMTCAQEGIMVGVGEGTFLPDATLTEAECVMLAYRLYDKSQGGDGSVMKRPERYRYIKLATDDGLFTHEGDGGDRSKWDTGHPVYAGGGLYLYPKNIEGSIPGLSMESNVAATVTVDGVGYKGHLEIFYQGQMRPTVLAFVAETLEENNLVAHAATITETGHWWSDLGYTLEKRGLLDSVFPSYDLSDREAERYVFADLLGAVTDLPKKFDVLSIPDVGRESDDHIYKLYEAGVIGGLDAYGTFGSTKTLTRAEAAVMVARILDESQRLTAPHKPMPKEGEGYTLTYLMDGIFASWYMQDTYPYCVVGDFGEGGFTAFPVGLLTLEGEYTPWSDELWQEKEKDIKAPEDWRNWGSLDTDGCYYRRGDGTPATKRFDWCGKIGPDGRGFVQKDGKLYRIEFTQP